MGSSIWESDSDGSPRVTSHEPGDARHWNQNTAAHLLTGNQKRDRTTPILTRYITDLLHVDTPS